MLIVAPGRPVEIAARPSPAGPQIESPADHPVSYTHLTLPTILLV